MLIVFQRLKLLRRLYKATKEAREVHVPHTTLKPSPWRRRISRYGWMGTTDMRNDSFMDNFTSGSRSSASRSDLLKLPIDWQKQGCNRTVIVTWTPLYSYKDISIIIYYKKPCTPTDDITFVDLQCNSALLVVYRVSSESNVMGTVPSYANWTWQLALECKRNLL